VTYMAATCCGDTTDTLNNQALHGNAGCGQAEGLAESDVLWCCVCKGERKPAVDPIDPESPTTG
jgi:hypothetical protein